MKKEVRVHTNVLIQSRVRRETCKLFFFFIQTAISETNATHTASGQKAVLEVLPEENTSEDELENGHVLKTVT